MMIDKYIACNKHTNNNYNNNNTVAAASSIVSFEAININHANCQFAGEMCYRTIFRSFISTPKCLICVHRKASTQQPSSVVEMERTDDDVELCAQMYA